MLNRVRAAVKSASAVTGKNVTDFGEPSDAPVNTLPNTASSGQITTLKKNVHDDLASIKVRLTALDALVKAYHEKLKEPGCWDTKTETEGCGCTKTIKRYVADDLPPNASSCGASDCELQDILNRCTAQLDTQWDKDKEQWKQDD